MKKTMTRNIVIMAIVTVIMAVVLSLYITVSYTHLTLPTKPIV